jgi:hypothetical protein
VSHLPEPAASHRDRRSTASFWPPPPSPLSGGYAGAKRMLWLMAGYANASSEELGVGIKFQALLPRQIVGDTELGRAAAEAYARRKGVTLEAFLAGFGAPLTPAQVGEHVVTLLTDPRHESGVAFGLKSDLGIHSLDGRRVPVIASRC